MFTLLKELSANNKSTLELLPLPYGRNDLAPFISSETIRAHYDVHTKGYFKKQEQGDFFKAGAYLHNIYWKQFSKTSQEPSNKILDFIHDYFENFDKLKNDFNGQCMGVKGSGWVYLSTDGRINIIDNHEIKDDILLLQDCWEHAYYLDYGPNKEEFFENFWQCINWKIIEELIP